MTDKPPRPKTSLMNALLLGSIFVIIINPNLRNGLGELTGAVLNPIIGFNGHLPVITIMLAGSIMVLATTLLRHFTTDWIAMARDQAMMRHFNKEFFQAKKDNNTFKMRKLEAVQPDVMRKQQELSMKQFKLMPITMLVVIPMFAWMGTFVTSLDYLHYASPWNLRIDLLDTSVFPHWILLYMCLSIPLGNLIQKGMKYVSWRSRWKDMHAGDQ